MVNVAALVVLIALAAASPYVFHHGPDQVPAWENYDRDAGILRFIEVGGAMAAAGLAMHAVWFVCVNRSVRSANAFVQMVLSLFFVYNWGYLWFIGSPTPVSIGAQSGACAGYEIYGLVSEVLMLLLGEAKRKDMLLHHLMCVVFTVVTLGIYSQVSTADLFYWHLVWDSISRTLVSNVPFGLRYFSGKSSLPAANGLFFLVFLFVRWVEQAPIVFKLSSQPAQFDSPLTAVITVAWIALTALNVFWGVKLIRIGLGLAAEPKVKKEE